MTSRRLRRKLAYAVAWRLIAARLGPGGLTGLLAVLAVLVLLAEVSPIMKALALVGVWWLWWLLVAATYGLRPR